MEKTTVRMDTRHVTVRTKIIGRAVPCSVSESNFLIFSTEKQHNIPGSASKCAHGYTQC